MSSIEELKVIRLYRAFNTMLRMCADRGYQVRHPSAVAEAVKDATLYDGEGDGLPYDWFLRHFVVTPEDAQRQETAKSSRRSRSAKKKSSTHNEEEEEAIEEDDTALVEEEVLEKARQGQWIAMRNAMRLGCAIRGAAEGPSPSPRDGDDGVAEPAADADAEGDKKNKKKKKKSSEVLVFFSGTAQLSMKDVTDMREKAVSKGATLMMIVTNKVQPSVMRAIHELSGRLDNETGRELLRIQVFEEETLSFYVADHETVPHHEAMTASQAQAFLDGHHLNIAQLPRMLNEDPMVRVLGLMPGDVVKITRPSKESGPYNMYRQVV